MDLCKDTETFETLENSYISQQNNFVECKEQYTEWIKCLDSAADDDNVSVRTRASSVQSSRAAMQNAKAKRLVAEHRLKMLREKQRLERQQKEIENERELLEQESEIEIARIEESVFTESNEEIPVSARITEQTHQENERVIDASTSGHTNVPRDTSDSAGSHVFLQNRFDGESVSKVTEQSRFNGKTDNTLTSGSSDSSNSAFEKLATILQEGFNLPKPELLTFNGSAIDYCKFIKNFETNVEAKVSDDRLRLSYLIQYCNGEAKSCIEDCVLLDSNEGYRQAKAILQSRYGRPHVIARNYIDKLLYGPQIKASDIDEISKLALDMQRCHMTLSQLGFVSDVNNSENLRRIVRRLPMHMRTKWADIAHTIYECGKEPRFFDLLKFVEERSRVACSVYGIDIVKENVPSQVRKQPHSLPSTSVKGKITTLSSYTESDKHKNERKCYCCSGSCLDLASCHRFKKMTLTDRKKYVVKNRLCFNCLKRNHMSNECRKEKSCTIPDCSSKHHTLLHSWFPVGSDKSVTQPSINCTATNGSFSKTCLGIIPVTVKGRDGYFCQTYALLDDGADKTLCDEKLIRKLNISSRPVTFQISTVNSTRNAIHGKEVDLTVSPISGESEVKLHNVWTVKQLPISTRSAATADDIRNIPYLSDLNIPNVNVNEVMLLIGTDTPVAHIPLEIRTGSSNEPYAVRTQLGWAVRGPIPYNNSKHNKSDNKRTPININFGQSSDAILQQQLERMWTSDFNDASYNEKNSMSVEDKRALGIMESTLSRVNGHYEMGLPWRQDDTKLPNNLVLAHARLNHLKRKLSRDNVLHEMYTKTMTDYIDKGFAKEVTNKDTNSEQIWYLPHHPVANVNKPGKVRVVFDCAAKYKGISLNSQLLQGPDMMNSLVGVLTRFRQEKVALSADIEAMFHQVCVCEKDCDALRFLWWPGGDLSITPMTYCMKVHLFGATSSPSCAAYALRRTAIDNAERFEPAVLSTVKRNFYVDDCLKSVESEDKAVKLAADLQSLMSLGGFRVTKWISNSRRVLNTIPESERAPTVVSLNPRDVHVDGIGLVVDNSVPRGQWPLGRVTEVIKGLGMGIFVNVKFKLGTQL
ncbi:uncharacterized protein LOC132755746 [Ruditapes philippinarum]|uniref:uncharacterized protein LOC132755746 n=1 Tax=Ruditapes philippinarum TaxID=129788 RepID=UPI00295A5E9F|nr:uncharacterized protein LOC132755746 [Ruditapes philippinarum]